MVNSLNFFRSLRVSADVYHSGLFCGSAQYEVTDEPIGVIHFVKEGSVRFVDETNEVIELSEGSLLFYPKMISHSMNVDEQENADLVCAFLKFDASLDVLIMESLPRSIVLSMKDSPELFILIRMLFDESSGNRLGSLSVLNRIVELAIVLIVRIVIEKNDIRSGILSGLLDPKLSKVLNAIHDESCSVYDLAGLAEISNMSQSSLSHRFKDVVGVSLGAYITEWKLSVAKSLLLSGLPVSIVSEKVGYSSQSSFSKVFKKEIGIPPKAWLHQQSIE